MSVTQGIRCDNVCWVEHLPWVHWIQYLRSWDNHRTSNNHDFCWESAYFHLIVRIQLKPPRFVSARTWYAVNQHEGNYRCLQPYKVDDASPCELNEGRAGPGSHIFVSSTLLEFVKVIVSTLQVTLARFVPYARNHVMIRVAADPS